MAAVITAAAITAAGNNNGNSGGNGGGGAGGGAPVTTPLLGNPRDNVPPLQWVPPTGVITVAASDFGRDKGSIRTAPVDIARDVLSKAPDTKTDDTDIAEL